MKALILKSILMTALVMFLDLSYAAAQSSSTPGNSSNPGGQGGGPGDSDDPVNGSTISGTDGNQGLLHANSGNAGGTSIPIDGGVGFLLSAGAAYGLKKLRDHYRYNQNHPPDTNHD